MVSTWVQWVGCPQWSVNCGKILYQNVWLCLNGTILLLLKNNCYNTCGGAFIAGRDCWRDCLPTRAASPARMRGKVLGVIGVLLIFLKVQFCQQLAGFKHGVVSILQNDVGAVNLWGDLEVGRAWVIWCEAIGTVCADPKSDVTNENPEINIELVAIKSTEVYLLKSLVAPFHELTSEIWANAC